MKRIVFIIGWVFIFAVSAISGAQALECFSCTDAVNLRECKSVEKCAEGQVCFKKRECKSQVQYDMGCIDKESFGRNATHQNGSEITKVSVDKSRFCYECCSEDKCNGNLCIDPPPSLCQDDKSVDCAKMNSMFDICKVTSNAKKICPQYCNLCDLVDGKWSPWSSWTSCDVTCGSGSVLRHRSCTNPAPQNGGLDCPGNGSELKTCQLKSCPVHGGWSSWDVWGECSATCGIGMQSRKRSCTNPSPDRFGDHCFGNSIEDTLCNTGSCAINGGWNDWTQWGKCSVTCGVGLQSRVRSCTNPTPANAGEHCIGQNYDVKLCYNDICLETGRTFVPETDCSDIKNHKGKKRTGVYNIRLWKTGRVIPVYCDFETGSGGWTVFQYRFNGSVDFYRDFNDYDNGFGSLDGEFWLGLRNIYEMVSQGKTELRLDLTAANGEHVYETFQNFRLGQSPYYTLHIDRGVGTAGDKHGFSNNNGQHFSTHDVDRDAHPANCAVMQHGAWWYKYCTQVNLNGKYVTPGTTKKCILICSMYYYQFKDFNSLKISKMMFRRI